MGMYCAYDIYAENGQAVLCGGKGEKKRKTLAVSVGICVQPS